MSDENEVEEVEASVADDGADDNGNGAGDLLIGVAREAFPGIARAGRVAVIYGKERKLTAKHNQSWSQRSAGILGDADDNDRFGLGLRGRDGRF